MLKMFWVLTPDGTMSIAAETKAHAINKIVSHCNYSLRTLWNLNPDPIIEPTGR